MKVSQNLSVWAKTIKEAVTRNTAHVARYTFAAQFTSDKLVCDVACGTGYGCFLLSRSATFVVGIDISEEAILWAKKYFHQNNIDFFSADITNQWPTDRKFDVITSFETMEHVKCPDTFLEHIYSHLSPSGMLILSVPNGPRDCKRTNNPYHLHHFADDDLKTLISKFFSKIEYFSQAYKKDYKHYGTKFLRKARLLKKQPHFVNNYFFKQGLEQNLKTWVVIAQK